MVLAAGAAFGTLAVGLGLVDLAPAAQQMTPVDAAAVAPAAVAPAVGQAPAEQVVVDTVYVHAPAPTANPEPIVLPGVAAPAAAPQVVKVIRVVKGGEHDDHEGDDHEGDHHQGSEGGGDD